MKRNFIPLAIAACGLSHAASVLPTPPPGMGWVLVDNTVYTSSNTVPVTGNSYLLAGYTNVAGGYDMTSTFTATNVAVSLQAYNTPAPGTTEGSFAYEVSSSDISATFGLSALDVFINLSPPTQPQTPPQTLNAVNKFNGTISLIPTGAITGSPTLNASTGQFTTSHTAALAALESDADPYIVSASTAPIAVSWQSGENVEFVANATITRKVTVAETDFLALASSTNLVPSLTVSLTSNVNRYQLVAIPEPSSALMVLGSAAGLFFRRRTSRALL